MIKKIALAVLLFASGIAHSQTVDSTGNIIDPTKWNNVIPMTGTQLGQVEGTGGGPVPALNTDTNTIRFSYSLYTVSQLIAINSVLSGQGISVSGFNYSWKIYNDLENCCNTRGSLVGNVNFLNNSGKILESYTYDYSLTNTGANFQIFSGTETFTSPYQLNSLGDISISWTGKDMNFWSGYYGPRVRDTSLSLNYSVKQSSPTTPTTATTTTDVVAETTSAPATTITEPSTTQPITITESSIVNTSSTNNTNSSPTIAAVVETTKEPAQQTTQQTNSAPSLSSVMSMIQSNQARENTIAQTAVSQSNQVAQQAAKEAEQTAVATAMSSSSQSMEISKDSVKSETKTNKTNENSGVPLMASTASSASPIMNQSQASSIINPIMNTQPGLVGPAQQNVSNLSNMSMTQIANLPAGVQNLSIRTEPVTSQVSTQPTVEVASQFQLLPPTNSLSSTVETTNSNSSFFTNRADPLQDYVEKNSIMVASSQPEIRPTTVRTNVQDSTLAGNVRVERLQVVPNGYNMYLSLILRDVAFYESKEIYKNNALKDNARTMYFIEKGNTDTFNKMIEMQYK